jgi:CRP-like cAMP-binding protein
MIVFKQHGVTAEELPGNWSDRCRKIPAGMRPLAAIRRCRRGRQIYGRGDPAEHWYRIVSGAARKCALKADGRRQIVDFLLPNDFFGFTAAPRHAFAVEAVADGTLVACYPRNRLESIAKVDPELNQFIREAAFEAISRLQSRLLLLGPMTAVTRVGLFLLEMAERSPAVRTSVVELPMSRYDIADCLALSVETVSRALTGLQRRGAIDFDGKRTVRIVDIGALSSDGDGSIATREFIPGLSEVAQSLL